MAHCASSFFSLSLVLDTQLEEELLGVPVYHVYVPVMTTMEISYGKLPL
jgi:hypothetical protein